MQFHLGARFVLHVIEISLELERFEIIRIGCGKYAGIHCEIINHTRCLLCDGFFCAVEA
jgi:hypothetical protein